MSKLQNEDHKSSAQLASGGGTDAQLLNDTKIYVTANSLNKTLSAAITAGDIGGGGGGGGFNYITAASSSAEGNSIGSWVTYADASATPVDGIGGAPTLTFVASATAPLGGTYSFLLTPGALGNGVSLPITLQTQDQVKVVTFDFNYLIGTHASFTENDVTLYLYDITNNSMQEASIKKLPKSTNVQNYRAQFQTSSNSTSYRLLIHQATSATGYTIKFDRFSFGPQQISYGATVTDVIAWTPTGSWTNNSTYTGFYSRVGAYFVGNVNISMAGAPQATGLTINLPPGLSVDTARLASGSSSKATIGYGNFNDASTAINYILAIRDNTATNVAVYQTTDSAFGIINTNLISETIPVIVATSDRVVINFTVPILGWGAQGIIGVDAETRVISMRATNAGTQALTANATRIAATAIKDSHSAWDGDEFVVPISGDYMCSLKIADNAGATVGFDVYVDAVVYDRIITSHATSSGTGGPGAMLVTGLRAGQRIDFRCNSTVTAAPCTITIHRLAGPAAVAVSEKVVVRANRNATLSIPNNTITDVTYTAKPRDTHGALTLATGVFVSPGPGDYKVSATLFFEIGGVWAVGEEAAIYIDHNGTIVNQREWFMTSAHGQEVPIHISDIVACTAAGQTIKIQVYQNSGAALNLGSNIAKMNMYIEKAGV